MKALNIGAFTSVPFLQIQRFKNMELSALASPSTTSIELIFPPTEQPSGVVITGHTPDSPEWKALDKEHNPPNLKQKLFFEKGRQSMEMDGKGMEAREKIIKGAIISIVGIIKDGLPLELSDPMTIGVFLSNPKYNWMYEQWEAHIDERGKFWTESAKPPGSGSNALDGSMETNNEQI